MLLAKSGGRAATGDARSAEWLSDAPSIAVVAVSSSVAAGGP